MIVEENSQVKRHYLPFHQILIGLDDTVFNGLIGDILIVSLT